MKRLAAWVVCVLSLASIAPAAEIASAESALDWGHLPDLPMPLSGTMAGVSGDALIVAGGANFPVPLFEGGTKVWYDAVHVLPSKTGTWRQAGKLDHSLAYAASVTTDHGVVCMGGSDGKRHYADVFMLTWRDGKLDRRPLPPLPRPCAYAAAAVLGETIYHAGGQETPEATASMKTFWALDLSRPEPAWRELEPWPGPGRILPVAAVQDGTFHVISGADLHAGKDGKAARTYLADGYRYRPKSGWKTIADAPRPVVAGEATGVGQSHILVFTGDDGANVDRIMELKDKHPGFSRDVLAYHTITNTWVSMGTMPASLVTTNAVRWGSDIVIPGGEDRPGHRSAAVLRAEIPKTAKQLGTLDFIVLGVYLAALVLMGVYFSRREKTTDDFFLAGRRVPWWAAGLSIFGTQLSAITFMAIPAKVYATDWAYILGHPCILILAPVVVYLYLPFYRRLNVTTAYEYLEKRFNLAVRLFGSAAFILFQLGRMGIVLYLPAIALSAVTGASVTLCILIMGVLCTIYTVLGGIEAVIWTDVLQVIVLMGGALLSLFIVAGRVDGGFGQIASTAWAEGKFHVFTVSWDYTITAFWVVFVGNLFITLGPYTTDQAVIQRYLTTSNEKEAAKSIWTNAALAVPAALLFFSLGTALYVFYKTHPGFLNPALDTDAVFPWFISRQLPVGVAGLVIAGLFAAAMSSLDSSMNSMATAMVTDWYRRFKPGLEDHHCLNVARWLTVILGAFGTGTALYMAQVDIPSLWDLFTKVIGLLGGSLSGLFALGVFTRRANGVGGLIGAIVSVIVLYLVQQYTHIHFFLYAMVGVVTCFLVGYVMSVIIPVGRKPIDGMTIYTVEKASTT
ncbi:MAG: sodium/solute symporter [Phycisphaerae bacterium]|nr:sodium/solute symporter [Phycisphaerae bacterium]